MTNPSDSASVRTSAKAASIGTAVFVLACLSVQFLRPDLDWRQAPMSFYLLGPYGLWLQAGYLALAAALLSIGYGYYRALARQARSVAPALMFALAALGLGVTAIADGNLPQRPPSLEGWLHGVGAQTAFLCSTTAMLLQAWRLRGDPLWRRRFAPAFALAALCFAAVWALSLWHGLPRGLAQKCVIALIAAWLALASAWLWRAGKDRAGAWERGTLLPESQP